MHFLQHVYQTSYLCNCGSSFDLLCNTNKDSTFMAFFLPPKLYMCSHSICRLDRYYLVCQFKYYPTKLRYSKITRYGMKTGLVLSILHLLKF